MNVNPIRKLVVGLLAGTLSGLVCLGIGGRIAMHVIGRIAHQAQGFSFAGSMDVVLFGAMIGAPAGAIYVLLRHRLGAWKILRGLVAGLLTYAVTVIAIPSRFIELGLSFSDILPQVLVAFGACFVLFGIVLEPVVARGLALAGRDI